MPVAVRASELEVPRLARAAGRNRHDMVDVVVRAELAPAIGAPAALLHPDVVEVDDGYAARNAALAGAIADGVHL